jgi:hypothetical protein
MGAIGKFLKDNGLSLAFWLLFVLCFAADRGTYNQERVRLGEPAMSLGEFVRSARLWFDVMQTWEAEFFAMAVFLPLTVVLRQDDSAESKPVWASDDDTGDTNE